MMALSTPRVGAEGVLGQDVGNARGRPLLARSCSATAARMWMVSLLACEWSAATNSTPEQIRVATKANALLKWLRTDGSDYSIKRFDDSFWPHAILIGWPAVYWPVSHVLLVSVI
jgi:hypothetical protein